jgi:hypothetical protein
MFFKKTISPDQFQFATIISVVTLYRQLGEMPSSDAIEGQVLHLIREFGGKLNSQQMQVLKLAATCFFFSRAAALVEKMAKSGEGLDPNDAAKLSDVLRESGVYFC